MNRLLKEIEEASKKGVRVLVVYLIVSLFVQHFVKMVVLLALSALIILLFNVRIVKDKGGWQIQKDNINVFKILKSRPGGER